jgi:DNA-binding response OmpR family regulator
MASVLIVEPDRLLARHYAAALRKNGHEDVWRSSGQAAIHAMEDFAPEVILLELQLGGHNGLEFLYELRSYPEWQAIPVILLTMTPTAALRAETPALERLGVRDYLYKPSAKLAHVVEAVNRLVNETSNRHPRHSFSSN